MIAYMGNVFFLMVQHFSVQIAFLCHVYSSKTSFMNSYLACHLTNIVIICTVSVLSEVLIWCYMVITRKSKPLDGGNRTRTVSTLQWRHNGRSGVSNHPPYQCVLNRLFRHRSKQTSKLCVTGLCVEFPAQMASNAENVLMTSSSKLQGRVLAPIIGTP